MSNLRDDINPGIFAQDAETVVPIEPIPGVPYRNPISGLENIKDGWPFEQRVLSEEYNEILFRVTTLTDLLDRVGLLGWSNKVDYDKGYALTFGSNLVIYELIQANGPNTPEGVRDPTLSPLHWRIFKPDASTTVKGVAELATNAETQAGADSTRIVTPAGLSSRTATTGRTGIAELATQAETDGGSDNSRIVTPATLTSGSNFDFSGDDGEFKLPSWLGGASVKWGNTTDTSADPDNVWIQKPVSFNTPFTTSVYRVIISANGSDSPASNFTCFAQAQNIALGGFNAFLNKTSGTWRGNWIAIGI